MHLLEKNKEKNGLLLKFSVDFNEFTQKKLEHFQKEVHNYNIPGFRAGKAPLDVFEQFVGMDFLLRKTIADFIDMSYFDFLKEEKLDIVSYPFDIDIQDLKEAEPIVFTYKLSLKPEFSLKKYLGLEIKKDKLDDNDVEITVEKAIENIKLSFQDIIETEDMINYYNYIDIKIEAWHQGKLLKDGTFTDYHVYLEDTAGLYYISNDFTKNLLGLKKGDQKNFQCSFKNEVSVKSFKNKDIDFEVEILGVKKEVPADITDSLIKEKSNGIYESIEDFKSKVREGKRKLSEQEIERKFENELVEKLFLENPIEIPEFMIENELDNLLKEFATKLEEKQISLDAYMKYNNLTKDDVVEKHRTIAKNNVHLKLILEKIIEAEKIKANQTELDAFLEKTAYLIMEENQNEKLDLDNIRKKIEENKDIYEKYLLLEKAIKLVREKAKVK